MVGCGNVGCVGCVCVLAVWMFGVSGYTKLIDDLGGLMFPYIQYDKCLEFIPVLHADRSVFRDICKWNQKRFHLNVTKLKIRNKLTYKHNAHIPDLLNPEGKPFAIMTKQSPND